MRTEHPAAALFPVLQGADLQELADDIREHGLLEPIELLDGAVLDGRSRLAACELAGVEPDFTEANIDDLGPTVYVVSKNLKRRHLTVGQRAVIARKMLPLLAREAKTRQGTRTDLGRQLPGPKTQKFAPAAQVAAETVGVSPASVKRAAWLAKHDPEALEQVEAGTATLVGAVRRAHEPRSSLAPIGSQKRGGVPVRERLHRVGVVLSGYVLALQSLDLGKEDCEEELLSIVKQARALARSADGLRNKEGKT